MHDPIKGDLKDAHEAARRAVRAYVQDPSRAREVGVEEALLRVRRLDGVARWRRSAAADRPLPATVA
jgi:hypothetical protein